ncbi:hypothetical protein DID76_00070 [Candidatus Marinamargulisbacteria bacterium SCGC AG-414-C22]|nr:hypothetical protein DID76_00070 [Candidatus Marinamargulisbacteria bacterium SCGC AG-414-C22]
MIQSALSAFSKPKKLDIKLLTPSTMVSELEKKAIAQAALEVVAELEELEDHSSKHDQATGESKKRSLDEGSDDEVASILAKKPRFVIGRENLHSSDSPLLLVSASSKSINEDGGTDLQQQKPNTLTRKAEDVRNKSLKDHQERLRRRRYEKMRRGGRRGRRSS